MNNGVTMISTTITTTSPPSMDIFLKYILSNFATGRTMKLGLSMPASRMLEARNCIINREDFLKINKKEIRRNKRRKNSLLNPKKNKNRE